MGAAEARNDTAAEGRCNPYWIDPASPFVHVVNVSGGRSSGMMLHRILEAHGGALPPRCYALFANTGKERRETLDFVDAMSRHWAVPITWLEFGHDPEARAGTKYQARVVDRASASVNGEPFARMLETEWVPSVTKRICTSELKVGTIDRHLWQAHGLTKRQTRKAIGFRFDEPKRWRPAVYEECRTWFPMVDAKVTRADVAAFWRAQPFDLGIPSDWSNCDLCYLRRRAMLLQIIREEPSRADWWIAAERRTGRTFRIGESFADLRRAALSDAGEISGDRGSDAGEISEPLPCFCSD